MEIAGLDPTDLLQSVAKRLVEASAGRGGLEVIVQFLDQIDWLQTLSPTRLRIKANTVYFETALSKCTKEMLKRPLITREDDITDFLGASCQKCDFSTTNWLAGELRHKCPNCGGKLLPTYVKVSAELIAQKITPSPETVLMSVAYDKLAQAYVDAYIGLGETIKNIAKSLGWDRYRVDRQILRYMNAYFYGVMAGEQKISREEKECMQFLVRGNLAGIPVKQAEKLLRLGITVVKFGYLYEVLGANGAYEYYRQKVTEFDALYSKLNTQIRLALGEISQQTAKRFLIKKAVEGYYHPCWTIPQSSWASGMLSGEVVLQPKGLPVFTKENFAAVQAVYAKFGAGKTFLLSSLICYGFHNRKETTLVPLNDKSNSYSLAFMPLFAYNQRTTRLLELVKMAGAEPQGIPTLTIYVVRKGEKVENVHAHPPTIYDRILEVEDYRDFRVDFDEIMDELKTVAENYGYSRPVGLIAFRNLNRDYATANFDVQAATSVLSEFDRWRKEKPQHPMRVVLDEVSYMASVRVYRHGSDKLMAGATVIDFLKEARRNNLSVDVATQLPLELMQDLRDTSTNIFFRDLAVSKDKTRSQIDFLLESIQLRDPTIKTVIREMNNRGLLPKGFWFWHHQPTYTINVIRPCPPTFMVNDRKRTHLEIIKDYEKQFGEKVLLKSWNEVKKLKPTKSAKLTHHIPDF